MTKPLAVYIHWPFCKSKCPYCDFNSHVREKIEQERWRKALLAELEHMAAAVPGRTATSIFFGGGTPSLMPPETVGAIIERVRQLWPVADDIEITLEANPTSVEANTFPDFKAAGINRISLGVQSLQDEELKFLGRGHSAREALAAVGLARKHFSRFSFDLIYARPGQTCENWKKELAQAIAHAGGHLSLYQLTIEENTAFHHAYAKKQFTLPGEEESEALYRLTEEITEAHGFCAYEISNYAKPGEESRHNLAYWKGDDYVGVGPGAHGRISQQGRRIATQTIKSPERWLEHVEKQGHAIDLWEEIDRVRDVEERIMMGLRVREGISYKAFQEKAGFSAAPFINEKKRQLFIREGLLENIADALAPTLKGRLVLNRLTAELLS